MADASLSVASSSERAVVTFNGEALNTPSWAEFTMGYGNVYGGYTLDDKKEGTVTWQSRIPSIVSTIGTTAPYTSMDLLALVELHEANDLHVDFLTKLRAYDPTWSLAIGDGGNQLFYRTAKYTVGKVKTAMMPGNRILVDFPVKHLATGVDFHVIVVHFVAGSGATFDETRRQQAAFTAQWAAPLQRAIVTGDINSGTASAGFARSILASGGFLSLRDTSESPINASGFQDANGNPLGIVGTFDGLPGGPWIEDIWVRRDREPIRVTAAQELVAGGALSDHKAWLAATIRVASVVETGLRFSLYRESDGRRVPVAGWQAVKARTSVITDHTAPLNRPVRYVASLSDGTEVSAAPVTLTAALPLMTHPVSGEVAPCWVQEWPELARESASTVVRVPGRRSPIVLADIESLPTSSPVLLTRTTAQERALDALFDSGDVLLLRTTDPRVPDAFLAVTARQTARVQNFRLSSEARSHTLTVQEVGPEDMNEPGLGLTLGDIGAAFPGGNLGQLAAAFPGGTLLDIAGTDWKSA